MNEKVQVTQAKEFCQQKFSNRSKEKSKAADSSKPSVATSEASKTQNTLSSGVPTDSLQQVSEAEDNHSNVNKSTLPSVRGSFKTFDCERAKKVKVVLTAAGTKLREGQASDPEAEAVKTQNLGQDNSTVQTSIASTSWLHKAKEGTASLASMFDKSAKTD